MSEEPIEVAQWTLDVTVFHSRGVGHRLRASVLDRRGGWRTVGSWPWKGLGFPEELLPDIDARVCSVIHEHLITRYGIAGQLPFRWAGEPGDHK
jgi:hypothetical protein